MEAEWHWWCKYSIYRKHKNLEREGNCYELWRIWWTICTTRIKRKIK